MSATAETEKSVFGAKSAAVLGGVFLGIYAVFALLAATDRAQRPELEVVTSPSAVGEPAVLTLPEPITATTTLAVVRGGVPLVFVKYEASRDDAMRKAGVDDTGKIPLYRRIKSNDTFKAGTYVKLAPGLYVLLGEEK